MAETTEHALIARFASVDQAEEAARLLMQWDDAHADIKLGGVGVLFKDAQGELQTINRSASKIGRGAKVGMGLGVLAAVLSGGLTLIPSALAGAAGGGLIGSLTPKSLGLSEIEVEHLWNELDGGKAAVLVMCDAADVGAVTAQLTSCGGAVDGHPVASADLEAAAQAVEDVQPPAANPPDSH